MIRYILHFPDNTRAETMHYFMSMWKEAMSAKEQRDIALANGVTIQKLPYVGVPALVRRARARAR